MKYTLKTSIIVISLFITTNLSYSGGWELVNHLPDNQLDNLQFINKNVGFCLNHYILKKTSNGGQTWYEPTQNQSPILTSISVIDENNIWSVNYKNLLKSTNGGKSWDTILYTPKHNNTIFFLDSNNGWVLESGFLLKTINGGKDWKFIILGDSIEKGFIQFYNKSHGIISSFFDLYQTNDGGETWFKLPKIGNYIFPRQIHFIDSKIGFVIGENFNYNYNNKDIYFTSNSGQSWEIKNDSIYLNIDNFYVNDSIFIIQKGDSLFKSFDQEKSWQQITLICHLLNSVDFLDSDHILFAGGFYWHNFDNGSIIKVSNNGTSFFTQEFVNDHFISIQFATPKIGYATGKEKYPGLFKTIDSGRTWAQIYSFNFLNIHFSDSLHGVATTFDYNGNILNTNDGGYTWNIIIHNSGTDINESGHFYFLNDTVGWISTTDARLFFTKNGGRTVEQIYGNTIGNGISWFGEVFFIDSLQGRLESNLIIGPQNVLFSKDGGYTWYKDSSQFIKNISKLNLWRVTGYGIYNSKDCGNDSYFQFPSWEIQFPFKLIDDQISYYSDIFTMDTNNAWAVGPEGYILRYNPKLFFTISGRVTQGNIGLEGVEVSNGYYSEFTDKNGYYSFQNLDQGSYIISIRGNSTAFDKKNDTIMAVDQDITNVNFNAKVINSIDTQFRGDKSILITPNPASDRLAIEINGLKVQVIQILDILGNVVIEPTIESKEIDISKLGIGLYFVKFRTDFGIITQKLIIQR